MADRSRIRNIKLTLLRPGDMIPLEIPKYDQRIVLEALHNCIAHQDYTRCERILVTERPAELVFRNAGSFFDGSPVDFLLSSKTPSRYRNRFLAEAMVNLRMIDTMGFGIREIMFRGQAKRFLPLPDFDVSDPEHVVLHLPGRFLDDNYSRALLSHPDLEFAEILALDRLQKGHADLTEASIQALKRRKLIEGRKPTPDKRPITSGTAPSTTTTTASLSSNIWASLAKPRDPNSSDRFSANSRTPWTTRRRIERSAISSRHCAEKGEFPRTATPVRQNCR